MNTADLFRKTKVTFPLLLLTTRLSTVSKARAAFTLAYQSIRWPQFANEVNLFKLHGTLLK
jgi:hypothetical protein